MRDHKDPLQAANLRRRATAAADKRLPWRIGDSPEQSAKGKIYREGFQHGYVLGAAYSIAQIKKGKSQP